MSNNLAMSKAYKVKYLKSLGEYVLHVKRSGKFRRLWGYSFYTESMANEFARGNF